MRSQFVFWIMLLGMFACKKKEEEALDTQKPSIVVYQPTSNSDYVGGGSLAVDIQFTDNKELSQYKLEVHPNFDGHSHGKAQNEGYAPWEWDTIVNISGKEHRAQFALPIPAGVKAGRYHFTAMCIDAVGYEAPLKVVDISLLNPEDTTQPALSLIYPALTSVNEVQFMSGETEKTLTFQGTASDNKRVKGIKITLSEHMHEAGTSHTDEPIYEYRNFSLNGTTVDLSNFSLKLYREDLEPDVEYSLKITVYDGVGNSIEREAVVLVKML